MQNNWRIIAREQALLVRNIYIYNANIIREPEKALIVMPIEKTVLGNLYHV